MEDSAQTLEQTLSNFASLLSSAVTSCGAVSLAGSPSALSCFLSHVDPSVTCVSVPSLSLKNRTPAKNAANKGGRSALEESAAMSLASPILCTKEDVIGVPPAVLQNVLESFDSLTNSRLKSSLAALVRQTHHDRKLNMITKGGADNGGEMAARKTKIILNLFSSSIKALSITTVVTSFRVLSMDDRERMVNCENDLILPLVFEAILDVRILGQLVTVALRAPGTIKGSFRTTSCGSVVLKEGESNLNSVQISFDTATLLRSMMKQARLVVKKAMLAASGVANLLTSDSGKQFLMDPTVPLKEKVSLSSSDLKKPPLQGIDTTRKSSGDGSANEGDPATSSLASSALSRINENDSCTSTTATRSAPPVLCPLSACMPPPPPRRASCGSNLSSGSSGTSLRHSSSTSLSSLSEAVTMSSANASFGDLQSQSSGAPTAEGTKNLLRKAPLSGIGHLDQRQDSHTKSGTKRSLPPWSSSSSPSSKQGSSLPTWEKQHSADGKGHTNQDWQTVSQNSLQMIPHKKRRISSCPDLV